MAKANAAVKRAVHDGGRSTLQMRDTIGAWKEQGKIGEAEYQAAVMIRALVVQAQGQVRSTIDASEPVVDTSPSAGQAKRDRATQAKAVLGDLKARLGEEGYDAIMRAVVLYHPVTIIAHDFEMNKAARARGEISRATRDYVSTLIRRGLTHAFKVLFPPARGADNRRRIILATRENPRPSMDNAKLGLRPDLARA